MPINPARDFGPRLASFLTGYGTAFRDQYGNLYFWVPIIAPVLGALVGGALFKYLVERYLLLLPIDGDVPGERGGCPTVLNRTVTSRSLTRREHAHG